jgi:hypothetical protein
VSRTAPRSAWIALLAVAGVLATPLPALAAGIEGTITDAETGDPLGFASVQLLGERVRTGMVASEDGRYWFRDLPPGVYELTVLLVGYDAFRDSVAAAADETVVRDIALVPEPLEVETVEVLAERTRSEAENQVGFINLGQEQLKAVPSIGEPDPIRSLQLLPGVSAASDISSGLYVRGGGPDQTLILLDRVPIYNPTHAFGLFSTFNADAVGDVSLYKGAYPAEYTGRLGSVLDVRSRDGKESGFGGEGGISTIAGRLLLEGRLGKGSWLVSGRRTYLEPILNAIRKSEPNVPSYYFYDMNGSLKLRPGPRDNIRVTSYWGRDNIGFVLGTQTLLDWVWGNKAASGIWTHLLGGSVFSTVQFSGSEYESLADAVIFNTPFQIENRLRDLSLRGDITAEVNGTHTLRGGVSASSYKFTYNQIFNRESTVAFTSEPYDVTVYAEDEWQADWGTNLRGGIRTRYFSEGDRVLWEPRLRASQLLGSDFRLKLGAGVYHQYLQLVATEGFAAGDFYFPVDESVEPSRSLQAVFGGTWAPGTTYEFSAELYYTDLARLLIFDDNGTLPLENPTTDEVFLTDGEGYATGVELFVQRRTGRLRGWVGYTLGWTRRNFAELNQGQVFPPKYDRRHDISFVASYDTGPWTLGASFVYGTGQAFTPAVGQYVLVDPARDDVDTYVLPGEKNSARLLPYHRFDVSVARDFSLFGLKAEWFIQIFNLYSRRNEWFIQYDTANGSVEPEIVRQLPIIPSLGVNFAF